MSEAEIPEHNIMVDCQEMHAELLDLDTGKVWQSQRSISQESYDALELSSNLRKVGIGTGVMDSHYFRRSPGAEADGPVAERVVEALVHRSDLGSGSPVARCLLGADCERLRSA